MDDLLHAARDRSLVVWLMVVAAAVAVAAQLIEGPPGSGYGWGSVVVATVLLVVPLAGVALMVRSAERRFAWTAITVAVLMTALVLVALVGNWSGQGSSARILDLLTTVILFAAAVGVVLVEVRLLRQPGRHRPSEGRAARR